jgi:hypothetical protein
MFGLFSISKILVTAAIIFAVWQGFKWLGNRQAIQKQANKERVQKGGGRAGGASASRSSDPVVEDMVQCPDCGAYVADDGRHRCG